MKKNEWVSDIPISEVIDTPCKVLRQDFDEVQLLELAYRVADHYQSIGFPFYDLTEEEIIRVVEYMDEFDPKKIEMSEGRLQQNMMGLNLANMFHPEMWSASCRGKLTPMDIFNNRDKFASAIMKRIHLSDTKLAPFNIRKSLKIFGGVQSVSNFRPTVAKWVYSFCNSNVVLDPCAGYGGRMVGAFSYGVKNYVGVDPSEKSHLGNSLLAMTLKSSRTEKNRAIKQETEFNLVNFPFEDWSVPIGQFDTVFTSPPYHDIERYSDEPTQSYLRYPLYRDWVNGFLRPLVILSHKALAPNGFFVLNVAGEKIIKDTLSLAEGLFDLVTTMDMRLSKVLGNGKKSEVSHKTEPIFIFRKAKQ